MKPKGNLNTRAVQMARSRMQKALDISCGMCDTPFMKKPVTQDQQMKEFEALTPQKIEEMIQTKGWDVAEDYIKNMEMLKHRKGG